MAVILLLLSVQQLPDKHPNNVVFLKKKKTFLKKSLLVKGKTKWVKTHTHTYIYVPVILPLLDCTMLMNISLTFQTNVCLMT